MFIPVSFLARLSPAGRRWFAGALLFWFALPVSFFGVAMLAFDGEVAGLLPLGLGVLVLVLYGRMWWQERPTGVATVHLYVLSTLVCGLFWGAVAALLASDAGDVPTPAVVLAVLAGALLVGRVAAGMASRRAQRQGGVHEEYHARSGWLS